MKASAAVNAGLALGVLGALGLLFHLETKASDETTALRALRKEIADLRTSSGPSRETSTWEVPRPVRTGPDPDAVQAIARAVDQLQAQRAPAATAASASVETAPAARGADQQAALADASEVANRAIALGKLSSDDVLRMRRALDTARGTEAERDALHSQIATAINAQKLAIEDPHFVYP